MEHVCTCEVSEEEHTCPYAEEILGSDAECTCCPECTYQCAMDI